MPGRVATQHDPRLVRRCLACGASIHPESFVELECRSCGCDFLARPPRSYAELEGFIDPVDDMMAVPAPAPASRAVLTRRWIAFGLLVVGFAMLTAALIRSAVH